MSRFRKSLLKRCCLDQYIRERFFRAHGYPLNLDNPRTFTEKLHWVKANCDLASLADFVDKYTVREFVAERVGEEVLVPLLGLYSHFEEIDYGGLPSRFMLKATHGCGWNVRVEDKRLLDWHETGNKVRGWLRSSYYSRISGEANYRNITGRIIIEKYLRDPSGNLLDFRFYCFDGKPVAIHVSIDRPGGDLFRVFNTEWKEFKKHDSHADRVTQRIDRPDNLNEMLAISEKLSAGFPFVRVDLYNVAGKIYFSELTFTPNNGLSMADPKELDRYYGDAFNIEPYRSDPYCQVEWSPTNLMEKE
ncbi:ATP-grasp fold amidoligase family protein [Candidatus Reidiella endopervernicosa]|uniref:ATP-grasp fold amidoligase family protein n=1 Tax=Candidatus Reidiella endopervernicosa TaxID=2738883 RepID=UPI001F2B9A27|nr:ATP-grasp fold amidoligase family protein [Candidatus Reidiella endopervernicosa]